MARLNKTADGKNQQLILEYLENNASDVLVEKINTGTRSIADCWRFITGKARSRAVSGSGNGSCAVISDEEVFGWAVHFFEESSEDLKKEDEAEAKAAAARRAEQDKQRKQREAEAQRKAAEEEKRRQLAEEAERKRKEKEKAEAAARKAAEAEERRKKKEFDATGAVSGQSSLFDFFSLEE